MSRMVYNGSTIIQQAAMKTSLISQLVQAMNCTPGKPVCRVNLQNQTQVLCTKPIFLGALVQESTLHQHRHILLILLQDLQRRKKQ
jgi:hypothetical protein